MFITLQVGRCNVLVIGNNKTINPPYNVMTQNLPLDWSSLKLHCTLCVFDHCLSHGEPMFNTWAHHNCLNVVCFINLILFSQKERYVMCICSLSPSLLSPKSIKLNEDSSPIPSRASYRPRGLGLPRSNFQNFNSNIHNGPRRNKQLDFAPFHKQSSHIWVFRIIVHLKVFFVYYMFQLEKYFLRFIVFLLIIMFHAFCL